MVMFQVNTTDITRKTTDVWLCQHRAIWTSAAACRYKLGKTRSFRLAKMQKYAISTLIFWKFLWGYSSKPPVPPQAPPHWCSGASLGTFDPSIIRKQVIFAPSANTSGSATGHSCNKKCLLRYHEYGRSVWKLQDNRRTPQNGRRNFSSSSSDHLNVTCQSITVKIVPVSSLDPLVIPGKYLWLSAFICLENTFVTF